MVVLQLFSITNDLGADKTKLSAAFVPIKTWNIERAERHFRPGIVPAGNSDNADVAGPDSVYDYYA